MIEKGAYTFEDLPQKLPMTMKGAIQAARFTLDVLGGQYEGSKKTYLQKRQYFDYKTTKADSNSSTIEFLQETLLHYELIIKDGLLLRDWVKSSYGNIVKNDKINEFVSFLNNINRIYDSNTKEFDGIDISSVSKKNTVCLKRIKSLLLQKSNDYIGFDKEITKLFQNIKEFPKNSILKKEQVELLNRCYDLIGSLVEKLDIFNQDYFYYIEQYLITEEGYKETEAVLNNNLNHSKKGIKILKTTPKIDNLNDFINLCNKLLKINIKQKILFFVKHHVELQMDHYYESNPIEITSKDFQKLGELIKEWYGIELDYLKDITLEEPVLLGSKFNDEHNNIGWINPYFGKYSLSGLSNILALRVDDLELTDIKLLQGIFIDKNLNNIISLLSQIYLSTETSILVPLNLYNKHATGLVFEKFKGQIISIKYFDPENNQIPDDLKQIFEGYNLEINQIFVESQKYNNCGPKIVEDFINYLTGDCLSQEEAIAYHSYLTEQNLIQVNVQEMGSCSDNI